MRILDVRGIEIREGSEVFCQVLGRTCKITSIQTPGVIDKSQPGRIVLEFDQSFPNPPANGPQDVGFADLMVVPTKEDETRVAQIIDAVRKKPVAVIGGKHG